MEGWVHDYAIQAAVREIKNRAYERVFTTGGPLTGTGGYTSDFNTSARIGAARLRAAGVANDLVQMVPCREFDRDRTFCSAVALRQWLQQHQIEVRSLNVITENTHARRTRLMFEEAFGPGISIGIISVPSPDYDCQHWWRYSQGVEDVTEQGVAYLYARLVFSPARVAQTSQPLNHEMGKLPPTHELEVPRPGASADFIAR